MNKKILLAIPSVIATIVLVAFLGQISTDVEQRKAFANVTPCGHDLYLDGFDFRVDICMHNPGNVKAVLDRADVWVYDGDNEIATVDLPYNIQIPPGETVWVDADLTFSGLRGMLSGIMIENQVVYWCGYYDSPIGPFESCNF